ncbi:hypothetical protein B6V76_18500 [Thioclava sp. IC9]|nr:hypothetical protein B6V76_18500 [Thioclava sp. IC9]
MPTARRRPRCSRRILANSPLVESNLRATGPSGSEAMASIPRANDGGSMQRASLLATSLPALRRGLQLALNAMAAVGVLWIFAIMLLIVADVAGRNFLAAPIIGVAEIAARSVVAIVFLLLPAAALNGTLIRSDFVMRGLQRLSPRAVQILDGMFGLAGAVIFGLVALAAWPDTHDAWVSSEFFGVRGVWTLPTFPFHLLVVLGASVTSLASVFSAVETLLSRRTEENF